MYNPYDLNSWSKHHRQALLTEVRYRRSKESRKERADAGLLREERRGGMKQTALRSRVAVLVVAALLSLTGASVAATVSADEAQAVPGRCSHYPHCS